MQKRKGNCTSRSGLRHMTQAKFGAAFVLSVTSISQAWADPDLSVSTSESELYQGSVIPSNQLTGTLNHLNDDLNEPVVESVRPPVVAKDNVDASNDHSLTVGSTADGGAQGAWYYTASPANNQPIVGLSVQGVDGAITDATGAVHAGEAPFVTLTNYVNLTGTAPGTAVSSGNYPAIAAQSLGGNASGGVDGGLGSTATATNYGNLFTQQSYSMGMLVQSIGGKAGGGVDGGNGANGGTAGFAKAVNYGAITTGGYLVTRDGRTLALDADDSPGIVVRSIGAFGGTGGSECGFLCFYGYGGDGGQGGDAGTAAVENHGDIRTGGTHSPGILAMSIGGGGGNGGSGEGIVAVGGQGGQSGSGALVDVINTGEITAAQSRGIQAQSVTGGGGDGGIADGLVSVGGTGGADASAGDVLVENHGRIQSAGSGIFAQSIAGGGGAGGSTVGIAAIGGSGAAGGSAGSVSASNSGDIFVRDSHHSAIHAQSVGGGGGHGGAATAVGIEGDVAIGGKGSGGGTGGEVTVQNTGHLMTGAYASMAHGIFAQSIGGGGGSGGLSVSADIGIEASASVSVGGGGGPGGDAGAVKVYNCNAYIDEGGTSGCTDAVNGKGGTIQTFGDHSSAIIAQSVGGGGGNGGASISGGISTGAAIGFSLGGSGGVGGNGATVTVQSLSSLPTFSPTATPAANPDIATTGNFSHGISAHSVGGGGGAGGYSISTVAGPSFSLSSALGGQGGAGGDGGDVSVTSSSLITTSGNHSNGIFAQSVGGGGGHGGFDVAGSLGEGTFSIGHGGSGGGGGDAGHVAVTTTTLADGSGGVLAGGDAAIKTSGDHSSGVVAQSIGGGGGAGGASISGSISSSFAADLSFGGNGGKGGLGGQVDLDNALSIWTSGSHAPAVLAQSIGGGGGSGGLSVSAAASRGPAIQSSGINLSLLGRNLDADDGGAGNAGGTVNVTNSGQIATGADAADVQFSAGVLAQSIGGGGGHGGFSGAFALSAAGTTTAFTTALGGDGGAGAEGGEVVVTINDGSISTYAGHSPAVMAQSIGGGGGHGGMAVAVSSSISNTASLPDSISLTIGGSGGTGGNGGSVTVNTRSSDNGDGAGNPTLLQTWGMIDDSGTYNGDQLSSAIVAQSIGGGGGNGAISISLAEGAFAAALPDIPKLNLGSRAGGGGDGGDVIVNSNVQVAANGAAAILAQSIGGGGGVGGTRISGDFSFDETTGVGMTLGASGQAGGGGGNAGAVTVTGGASTVKNSTQRMVMAASAPGILAQSIGGGGGVAGWSAAGGIKLLENSEWGPASALAFGASGGAGGTASDVKVTGVSSIQTVGPNASGVLAQSIGGGGGYGGMAVSVSAANMGNKFGLGAVSASMGGDGGSGGTSGDVTVSTLAGSDVSTNGDNSAGIAAQSIGGGGGHAGGAISLSGSGNSAGASLAHGGTGGEGHQAGTVTVTNNGDISTGSVSYRDNISVFYGKDSPGILAQSIGGGGGHGGFAISADATYAEQDEDGGSPTAPSLSVAMGGKGGSGGDGEAVTVTSGGGSITTQETRSSGILAQSIGGGGGSGGLSFSSSLSNSQQLSLALGGSGGNSGNAGGVVVTNTSSITTIRDYSSGIHAQSLGGGGGAGGIAISTDFMITGANLPIVMALGGSGGSSGDAGTVSVTNDASISTGLGEMNYGYQSSGILAQSIGGGGGSANFHVGGDLSIPTDGLPIWVGNTALASGGETAAGSAGDVTISNNTAAGSVRNGIIISGPQAHAMVAQSIAGGGGIGSVVSEGKITLSGERLALRVGGEGGSSGQAGSVTVTDGSIAGSTAITTLGAGSIAILAQSITAGGGTGSVSAGTFDPDTPIELRLGAKDTSAASAAGNVTVRTDSQIAAGLNLADYAQGVVAQSIGGGGGYLYFEEGRSSGVAVPLVLGADQSSQSVNAGTVTVTVGEAGSQASMLMDGRSAAAVIAQSIGGGGGLGVIAIDDATGSASSLSTVLSGGSGGALSGDGAAVEVTGSAKITMLRSNQHGVVAQSIGGGGGFVLSEARNAAVTIGGQSNASGNGGAVSVDYSGDIINPLADPILMWGSAESAFEHDDDPNNPPPLSVTGSYGIIAQSIGGGGGTFSQVDGGESGSMSGLTILDAWQGGGAAGSSGNGGSVSVTSHGAINTGRGGSIGILAQSIAGGGGLNIATGQVAGGYGQGVSGDVAVTNHGTVTTSYDHAHGIVAQSISGDQVGGGAAVFSYADVTAAGAGASAIIAQAAGPLSLTAPMTAGSATVTVGSSTLTDTTVTGGSGDDAWGVALYGNRLKQLDNYGTITATSGNAVLALGFGSFAANNFGTITSGLGMPGTAIQASQGGVVAVYNAPTGVISGNIDLGLGTLTNRGVVETGARFTGNLLNQGGTISPFGQGRIGVTTYTGNLVASPLGLTPATLLLDLDPGAVQQVDRIDIAGAADIVSEFTVNLLNPHSLRPGVSIYAPFLTTTGGVTGAWFFNNPASPVIRYTPGPQDNSLYLEVQVDFNPAGLGTSQQTIGAHINTLLQGGLLTSDDDAALYDFVSQTSIDGLNSAYGQLEPGTLAAGSTATLVHANQHLASSMQHLDGVLGQVTGSIAVPNLLGTKGIRLAFNHADKEVDARLGYAGSSFEDRGVHVWLSPFHQEPRTAGHGAHEYKSRSAGLTGGVDLKYNEHLLAGLGVGWGNAETDFRNDPAKSEHDYYYLSAYGVYTLGSAYMKGIVSYGVHEFEQQTLRTVGGTSQTATADYDGKSVNVALELGGIYQIGDLRLNPFVGYAKHRLKESDFVESDGGRFGLVVDDRSTKSTIAEFGLKVEHPFAVSGGYVVPNFSATWKHELEDSDTSLSASFALAPDVPFTIDYPRAVGDRRVYGIGLTRLGDDGSRFMVQYSEERGSDYQSRSILGLARFAF